MDNSTYNRNRQVFYVVLIQYMFVVAPILHIKGTTKGVGLAPGDGTYGYIKIF